MSNYFLFCSLFHLLKLRSENKLPISLETFATNEIYSYFFHIIPWNKSHIHDNSLNIHYISLVVSAVMKPNSYRMFNVLFKCGTSSDFVSSSISSWQILTAHALPFRGARDLAFCLKVPLDSLLVWASSRGSGETARMRRLAWTFAARIGYKYQIRLTQPKL